MNKFNLPVLPSEIDIPGLYINWKCVPFKTLVGNTLTGIYMDKDSKSLYFVTDDKRVFTMEHLQDCCEDVFLEDVTGDFSDLLNTPILLAEESTSCDLLRESDREKDSFTWTFYKLATKKGYVDLRWFGESNGYYSEDVSLYEVQL